MRIVNFLLEGLVELIYPPACLACGNYSKEPLCGSCHDSLSFIEQSCGKCGKPVMHDSESCLACRGRKLYFDRSVSLAVFEGVFRELIHHLKYSNARYLSGYLTGFIGDEISRFIQGHDIVTFIPMDDSRKLSRGYNQAELIADKIGERYGLPVAGLIKNVRKTREQNSLGLEERRKNMVNAFEPARGIEMNKGKKILLVDDVYTTGHTVNEASRIIRQSKPAAVGVFTLARTVL